MSLKTVFAPGSPKKWEFLGIPKWEFQKWEICCVCNRSGQTDEKRVEKRK
jgi:hypothetical protein